MLLLAFLGGMLTIVSPCILPVVPLVFAARGRRFARDTVPMLLGLAASFAATAAVGTTAAHAVTATAVGGRAVALALVGLFGATLLVPALAERLARPAVRLGAALSTRAAAADSSRSPVRAVALHASLGVGIGMLWAPCAGPILGLLVAATAREPWRDSVLSLFAFAIGAAVSVAAVLWGARRASERFRLVRASERTLRAAAGAAALLSVALIASGWDRRIFPFAELVSTAHAETALVARLAPGSVSEAPEPDVATRFSRRAANPLAGLRREARPMPGFAGATEWINSPPLTPESLRGKVVLVEFWTFACYNCLNALPHVKELHEKYRRQGFVVVGVHTPELPHERVLANVRREVERLGITYPVVVDNDYAIWNAYHNRYWPAAYYVDATGTLRFSHFGEGAYEEQDAAVASLLEEARSRTAPRP